jgi:hypothetical protein
LPACGAALRWNDRAYSAVRGLAFQALQSSAKVVVKRDAPSAPLLGDPILNVENRPDLAPRIEHHGPVEPRDLAGSQAGLG